MGEFADLPNGEYNFFTVWERVVPLASFQSHAHEDRTRGKFFFHRCTLSVIFIFKNPGGRLVLALYTLLLHITEKFIILEQKLKTVVQ